MCFCLKRFKFPFEEIMFVSVIFEQFLNISGQQWLWLKFDQR